MLRKTALSFFVLFFIAAPFMAIHTHALNKPAQSIPAEQQQILVLKTYQYGLPIPDSIDRGLIDGLRQSGGSIRNLITEHLDLDRLPGSEYRAKVVNLLRYKLAGTHIGIIIAEGFPAVDFLTREGKGLFPDAAVLTLTTPSLGELSNGSRKVMDIPWRVDPAGTLRIAIDLFPNTRLVFVVTGARDGVLPFIDEARKSFAPWKGKLDFEYANKMTYDEMIRRISSLPPHSIIIYSPYFTDVTGRTFVPAEVVAKISKLSPVPVFATLEHYLGRGIVGGALLKTEDIGRQAIKVTLDYFTGKLQLIKTVTTFHTPIKMMFDWRELTRWNADTKRIPENSIIIERPLNLWSQYKNIVITTVIIFIAMILLIGGLMIINNRLKLMTAAAKKSEEQLNLVIKGSNDAPWDWDLITNELYYSPQWWAQLGHHTNEMPSDAALWERLMHPDDAKHVDSVFKRALDTGIDSYEVEFRLRHKKGHYVPVLSRGFITRDEDNKPIRVTGTNMDLTERKQAEEALQTAHKTLLTVLDSIDATIYVADMQNYEVLFMNRYMINSFGRDLTGEICWEVFRGESGPCSHCPNKQLINKNGTPSDVYVWRDKNPMTERWYINYDRAIEWTDGRLVKLQIATDITEMKQLEDQLRQAQKMESIGTLAGGIAHEFNNMLGIIIGNTELALDDIPEWNSAADCIQEIQTASLRAKDVVQKLLSVARKTPASRKPVQISTIIKESLDLMRKTIPATINIQQHIRCSTEIILADTTEISQIVMNLCTNAVHAMVNEKGILKVVLETKTLNSRSSAFYQDIDPGEYVMLTVSDDGTGISPDILDRIFEPYFTTKDVDEGLGMGLAVVHGIVKKHDGDIKVDSAVGKGTTVEVLFPLIDEQPLPCSKEIETLSTGTERILLVDDEASLVKMVTQMLTRSGYEVVGKTNSTEALNVFKENPDRFDLVITDMTMPEMTGDDIARQIIETRPNIPIILCTGHSNRMDKNKAKQLGIKSFVSKPLGKKELTETVRKVLDEAKG